jgi:hypothetical protein
MAAFGHNHSARPAVLGGMSAHLDAPAQRRTITAALFIAGLTVLSAGCGSSSTSTTGSAGAAASTTPASASAPAATTAPAPTSGTAPAATTAPPAAAPVDAQVEVYGNCTTPTVEPAEIVLACADYGATLDGLDWTSWTATSATAVGTLEYNDCTPSCAAGHHHDILGTRVTLTVPVPRAGGQLLWSRVQESPQPPGYATGPFHGGPQPLPLGPV